MNCSCGKTNSIRRIATEAAHVPIDIDVRVERVHVAHRSSSRVSKNHTLVVHLANSKNADFGSALKYYDDAMQHGRAQLVPPQLSCAPAPWSHAATKGWSECVNVAPCVHTSPSTSPPPPPPLPPDSPPPPGRGSSSTSPKARRRPQPPPLVGWIPLALREVCKAYHAAKQGGGKAASMSQGIIGL